MKKNQTIIGCLCALCCEVLFGLSYIFTKQATEQVSPFDLLGWRFLIAFVLMTILAAAGVIRIDLRGKDPKPLIAVAFFSPLIYFIGETMGISMTSAAESGVFLACIPVVSLLMSSIILKKKPTGIQVTGIAITLIGVALTVFAAGASASLSVPGYLFLLMAVVSYALYSVFVEKAAGYSEAELTYAMLIVGAVAFAAIALFGAVRDHRLIELVTLPVRNPVFLTAVLYQGIGCSIMAFFLSNMAIARIGVNRTSSFIGASTVVSIGAGILLLHEPFSMMQFIGATVIIAGIYTANAKNGKDETT